MLPPWRPEEVTLAEKEKQTAVREEEREVTGGKVLTAL